MHDIKLGNFWQHLLYSIKMIQMTGDHLCINLIWCNMYKHQCIKTKVLKLMLLNTTQDICVVSYWPFLFPKWCWKICLINKLLCLEGIIIVLEKPGNSISDCVVHVSINVSFFTDYQFLYGGSATRKWCSNDMTRSWWKTAGLKKTLWLVCIFCFSEIKINNDMELALYFWKQ